MRSPAGYAPLPFDFSPLSFLIVDDQPFSRRLVRSMLVGFGSREIYESANGVEAFDLARNVMPSVVVTDLIMPIFNGLRFIKMMKEPQSPARKIPIIVLSGYLTKAAALTVRDAGADAILVKPISPKALYEHIACIMLGDDKSRHPAAVRQDQKKLAGGRRKKGKDVTYL